MASRKAIAANGDAGEGPFNSFSSPKAAMLSRTSMSRPDEYEQLTTAFPGTTTGSIRNRISALRVKQRDFYESMGVDDAEEAEQTPSKKPRARKPKTPSKKAKSAAEAEEGSESEGKKVKDEAGDEEDM
ncbi:hypothetical protein P3342_002973 [Pyrenophora teres f. teres]|nr:hypothetical protein P3342_002973 [Pyrenophora teres f. teres]